ncbi:MAG: hypoxanthine phosphoribosyltransferase [Planctomycetota bacterium]|nr:hypoxanthine phosphoribosyltransferase [Planctomycetota bacterium]MDA1164957.1 hypoxanthine phosphoribosyltransferase [Planctomycetota bacterium]
MRRLIEQDEIQQRVLSLGRELSELYRGRDLTVIGVLTGCMLFMADLVRAIDVPHRIGVVQASSYRGATTRPGELIVDTGLLPDVRGRDVLIIDDIFDTGRTMQKLVAALRSREPASVRTVALLIKEGRSEVELQPDFHCFRIPDVFVIGYGLDYNDDYRHLPFVGALDEVDL